MKTAGTREKISSGMRSPSGDISTDHTERVPTPRTADCLLAGITKPIQLIQEH